MHLYLKDRSFSVCIGNLCSALTKLNSSVPQGSILGPILFSLYMCPLGKIFHKQYFVSSVYWWYLASVYISQLIHPPVDFHPLMHFDVHCLGEAKARLASDFLHLNTKKTECVFFGPPSATKEIISRLCFKIILRIWVLSWIQLWL